MNNMNKKIYTILVIFLIVALSACSSLNKKEDQTPNLYREVCVGKSETAEPVWTVVCYKNSLTEPVIICRSMPWSPKVYNVECAIEEVER